MTRDEAYDQMRNAATRLRMASTGLHGGQDIYVWQPIIDRALDDWLEARNALRRHRAAT